MADRDKVIKGLECCLANKHNKCPYKSTDDGIKVTTCTTYLMQDALSLLKAQEPRVMTLEDVKAHYSLPPAFPDDLGMQEDYLRDVEPLYFDFPNPVQWDVHWRGAELVNRYLEEWGAGYGKIWRVWTGKPTEEQRRETPWD